MPIIDLEAGAVIVLDAVDPTTGAVVTGVTFSNGILYADGRNAGGAELESPLPHWIAQSGD